MNPQKPQVANPPSVLGKIGGAVQDAFSSTTNYQAPLHPVAQQLMAKPPQQVSLNPNGMSSDRIKSEIAFRESGVSNNPYATVNAKTNDYGKYQVNADTLKTYSKMFLGQEVTPQQFLANPQLQEKFMQNAITHLGTLGAKSLDSYLMLWHKGWGNVSSKRLSALKQDPEVQKYLNNQRNKS